MNKKQSCLLDKKKYVHKIRCSIFFRKEAHKHSNADEAGPWSKNQGLFNSSLGQNTTGGSQTGLGRYTKGRQKTGKGIKRA